MPSKRNIRLYQISLAVGALLIWEVLARVGIIDEFFFPRPSVIFWREIGWFVTGEISHHLFITLVETMLAFVIGTGLGIGMGLWLALSPTALNILAPYIKALNAVPRVVLAPLFTLWFGLGIFSKVALGVSLVFFLAFFNTYQGVREVNPILLSNARLLGAGKWQLLRHVYLPSAAGWILSGLRTSIGFAVVGTVVGEYLGSSAGLGYLISQAEGVFDTVGVFAGVLTLIVFVLILDAMVNAVERRILVWRPSINDGRSTI